MPHLFQYEYLARHPLGVPLFLYELFIEYLYSYLFPGLSVESQFDFPECALSQCFAYITLYPVSLLIH